MKHRVLLLFLLLPLVLLAACGGGEKTRLVEVDGRLTMKIPVDMEPGGIQGIDSAVGRWANGSLELTYDLGTHAAGPGNAGSEAFRVSLLTIDGRSATIEYYYDESGDMQRPYVAALYIADTGGGDRLAMFVRSSDENGQDRARRIFRSIEFVDGSGSS
jgi:hypothetical protein